jgi:hypothetical protein
MKADRFQIDEDDDQQVMLSVIRCRPILKLGIWQYDSNSEDSGWVGGESTTSIA